MPAKGTQITVQYFAWNSQTGQFQTGDAGNHTLRILRDGTSLAPSNVPIEVDSTYVPGVYKLTISASENNGNFFTLGGKSTTASVSILPISWSNEHYLASNGLDAISISAPSGAATNFREMMVQVWRRFFRKVRITNTHLTTYADDNNTIITTQGVSDDGTSQTVNSA